MHHYQLITHADWGSNAKKRWFATARSEGGTYRLQGPEQLGEVSTFLARNRPHDPQARWLAGFDLQIGIPEAYAAAAGISEFTPWLRGLGRGDWDRFFDVATTAGEISLQRPFYPNNPGGRRQAHLLDGLGINTMSDLLRRCDRPSETRGAASTLFWTLGAKQVGKGAIIAWRDLILPALSGDAPAAALWPFEGTLEQLRAHTPITLSVTVRPLARRCSAMPTTTASFWKRRCAEGSPMASAQMPMGKTPSMPRSACSAWSKSRRGGARRAARSTRLS
jgi:hypothetical protein